jgi:hypothetical protein
LENQANDGIAGQRATMRECPKYTCAQENLLGPTPVKHAGADLDEQGCWNAVRGSGPLLAGCSPSAKSAYDPKRTLRLVRQDRLGTCLEARKNISAVSSVQTVFIAPLVKVKSPLAKRTLRLKGSAI